MDEKINNRAEREKQNELATAVEDAIERGEAPRSSRRAVLRQKGETRAEREARIAETEKNLSAQSALQGVRYTRRVVQGKIIGVEELKIDDKDVIAAAVLLTANKSKASIPFEEMYTSQVMDMSTVDTETVNGMRQYLARQRQMLAKLIGLEVNLCIKRIVIDFDGFGHDLIIGSRKDAAERLSERFFRTDNENCKEGETYEATVLSVSPHSLAATFNGIDFVIQQNSLTNRYLLDLQSHYAPGDKIPFIMEDLKINGKDISFRPNTIGAELAEMKSRWYMITANTVAKAVITHVRRKGQNGKIDIYAYLPDYDFACKIAFMNPNDFGRQIISGDEVQVLITGFRESGYLDARVRSVHGNAGLFTNF